MNEMKANLKDTARADWLGLHCSDARNLADIIPPESVDLVLTSPPYANLKDYGHPSQIGFGQTYEAYLKDLNRVFAACHAVSKSSGSMWIVSDTFKRNGDLVPLPFELSQQASLAGWNLQDVIIWHKTKTLPWSHRGHSRRIFEYIFFFTKSHQYKYYPDRIREIEGLKEWWSRYPERYNPRGKSPHNIWDCPIPTQGSWGNGLVRHFNPFPPSLVERIVTLTTDPGDIVLDPFAGTGTVLAQAACMGRRYVGSEINAEFVNTLFPKASAEIGRLWSERKAASVEAEQKQDEFESLIARLRKIKYAKHLIRAAIGAMKKDDSSSEMPIEFVFALDRVLDRSETKSRHKRWALDILVVVPDDTNVTTIENVLIEASYRPPLSKYGIESRIAVSHNTSMPSHSMLHNIESESDLWVYPATTDHWYQSCITLSKWLNSNSDDVTTTSTYKGIPPILSNIRISSKEVTSFRP